jgi:hypothetical protein
MGGLIDTRPPAFFVHAAQGATTGGNMLNVKHLGISLVLMAGTIAVAAQTIGRPEEFSAVAIVNNNLGSGAGRVIMRVNRWSTEAERGRLTAALQKGADALLDVLRDQRSVGTIRTPDSLGYDLRYAYQEPAEDGGRRIVIATDRPIGFWEARNQPRSIDYPFTVIQMEIGKDGEGKGTLSFATKVMPRGNVIILENFATSPVMLTKIEARSVSP